MQCLLVSIYTIFVFVLFTTCLISYQVSGSIAGCRDRSSNLRQDGGLCFEIPPWQYQPVQLAEHVERLRHKWRESLENRRTSRADRGNLVLSNSEVTRYMDTVIAPFLDTYHRNIQTSYQQLTSKILKRIKQEINVAVKRKQQIYKELSALADELKVPAICDEERRAAKTLASNVVAQIHECTEEARFSIAKMGKYAEEMIAITRNHMQATIGNTAKSFGLNGTTSKVMNKHEIKQCLKSLSRAAVELGYELDLSLTNARRHNEQSCEKLSSCGSKAKKHTEESISDLRDQLYQCVYA